MPAAPRPWLEGAAAAAAAAEASGIHTGEKRGAGRGGTRVRVRVKIHATHPPPKTTCMRDTEYQLAWHHDDTQAGRACSLTHPRQKPSFICYPSAGGRHHTTRAKGIGGLCTHLWYDSHLWRKSHASGRSQLGRMQAQDAVVKPDMHASP